MRKSLTGIVLGILALIGILVWTADWQKPVNGKFVVNILNVGQGDATYLQFPNGEDALIDGGPGKRVLEELGAVMPYWDKEINLLIITHNHADHIEGLLEVLKRYKVDEVWLSGAIHTSHEYIQLLQIIKDKKIPSKIVMAGDVGKYDEVEVKVIYPMEKWQGQTPGDQHEATVVTRWLYGKFSVLGTGDLGLEHINQLVNSGEYITSTILKVPHHGSATGLNKEFLEMVAPKVAVISVGRNNRYGHPSQSAINLLKNFGVKIYRTDEDGRIRIKSDGIGYKINY